MKRSTHFSPGVRERAVRLVREHQGEPASPWATIGAIAAKIGGTAETLRRWVRQAEKDSGECEGVTTAERERIKELEAVEWATLAWVDLVQPSQAAGAHRLHSTHRGRSRL
jgi:transposase